MDRDLERLRGLPLFRHAPDLLLQRVLHVACLHEVEAGAMLIRPDQDGRDYLGLLDGELEICRSYTGPGGAEEIHLGRIVSAVDEIALIHAMPRLTSVRAVTAARVLSIDGERVEELLAWSQRYANELRDLAPLRTRMNIVGQAGPFRYLPLENVQQAFEALVPIDAQAGAVVVRQGEPGNRYYLIESGKAEVWRTDPMTDEAACVAVLGAGDAFGEEALLIGGFRNATVTMTEAGRLWALGKSDFESLVKPKLVMQVEAVRAYEMINRGEARWLDCRYDVEFAESHLPGALNIPLDHLRERIGDLEHEVTYIVYCRSGRRSACAAYLLRERGFRALSLVGGISDWPYALEGC